MSSQVDVFAPDPIPAFQSIPLSHALAEILRGHHLNGTPFIDEPLYDITSVLANMIILAKLLESFLRLYDLWIFLRDPIGHIVYGHLEESESCGSQHPQRLAYRLSIVRHMFKHMTAHNQVKVAIAKWIVCNIHVDGHIFL